MTATAHALDPAGAVSYLTGMSVDLRGCAVVGADGRVLAATGDAARWAEPAQTLIEAADAAGGEPFEHVHVATEDAEVFAVRGRRHCLVAVTDRFVLASLMAFDMRAVLRDLEGGES